MSREKNNRFITEYRQNWNVSDLADYLECNPYPNHDLRSATKAPLGMLMIWERKEVTH